MTDRRAELEGGLSGRYRLERELGRGGTATVYLAHDLKHDRPVALKLLHPDVTATLGAERFRREIRVAARLQHPHILTVLDSGEFPDPGAAPRLWFTMPYVEGKSLRERLGRSGSLPGEDAVRICREVAQALQYAHDHGVIHRDIKPENILLTRDGNTLVADFGIARSIEASVPGRMTTAGLIVGTPAYMSPEQASGEATLDGRSDIYSLGCVLYEMLSGQPPFTGPTVQSVIGKHLSQPPPPLATGAQPAQPVIRALERSLAKAPEDRFGSMADFAAALETTPPDRSAPRRGLLLASLGAAALVLVVGYAALGGLGRAHRGVGGSLASSVNRKLSQLTSGEGVEEWPALSPDGRRLVYVAEADGYRQLFLRDLSGGPERRLTRGDRDDIQPAWSPDGRRVVFARAQAARGKLEPTDINGWYQDAGEIWTVDLESGAEAKLLDDAFGPALSPDGTRLAFDARWAGPRRIWVADASGRNPRQVTSDSSEAVVHSQPRWSPDGRRIAFRRIENIQSDVAVVDLSSQAITLITRDNVLDLDPAWSPDGRYLYFSSARGGGLNLWRADARAGGRTSGPAEQLTTGAGDDVQPVVAPDGRRLVFAVRGINADLWRLPVSPRTGEPVGDPAPVLVTSRVESRPAWSPDSRTLAFNSDRAGEMNLWVRDLAEGGDRQVTTGPGGDYQPNWSPDGRRLVFFSARAGSLDIWSVELPTGRPSRLTDDPGMDTNPFYSPDGQRIAFMSDRSGRAEVWLMRADGSEQRQLTSVGVGGHFLRWTPDGGAVVFRSDASGKAQIFRVPATSGEPTRMPDISSGAHMSFSPGDSLILDVRGHKTLWVYPLSGRPPYRTFEFADPEVRIDYPTWSPDGRWVAFDRAAPRGGDLWLVEGLR